MSQNRIFDIISNIRMLFDLILMVSRNISEVTLWKSSLNNWSEGSLFEIIDNIFGFFNPQLFAWNEEQNHPHQKIIHAQIKWLKVIFISSTECWRHSGQKHIKVSWIQAKGYSPYNLSKKIYHLNLLRFCNDKWKGAFALNREAHFLKVRPSKAWNSAFFRNIKALNPKDIGYEVAREVAQMKTGLIDIFAHWSKLGNLRIASTISCLVSFYSVHHSKDLGKHSKYFQVELSENKRR